MTDIVDEVCTVVNNVRSFCGVPHKVVNDAETLEDKLLAVLIDEIVIAGCGDIFVGCEVVVIEFLLEDGSVVALEGHEGEVFTSEERLVTDRGNLLRELDAL